MAWKIFTQCLHLVFWCCAFLRANHTTHPLFAYWMFGIGFAFIYPSSLWLLDRLASRKGFHKGSRKHVFLEIMAYVPPLFLFFFFCLPGGSCFKAAQEGLSQVLSLTHLLPPALHGVIGFTLCYLICLLMLVLFFSFTMMWFILWGRKCSGQSIRAFSAGHAYIIYPLTLHALWVEWLARELLDTSCINYIILHRVLLILAALWLLVWMGVKEVTVFGKRGFFLCPTHPLGHPKRKLLLGFLHDIVARYTPF